ncbi:hypothetical protein D3C76_1521640 [compost metagenome]
MLSLPVSVNSIRPTRNWSASSALITDDSASISLLNGVFQFAVLSRMIRTFGADVAFGGVPTNRSMSSAQPGCWKTSRSNGSSLDQ